MDFARITAICLPVNSSKKAVNNYDEKVDDALKQREDVNREPTARELEIARILKEDELRDDTEIDKDPVWSLKRAQIEKPSRQCPYLDTIDR